MQQQQPAPVSRVFVGIKVAPEIARQLAQIAASLDAYVRPTAEADIHLTLVAPWNEASIADAIAKLAGVAAGSAPFLLTFQHVGYGPQPRRPRLLWADCAPTDALASLRLALLQAYGQTDERPFLPHVTLARIRGSGFAIARKQPIDRPLALTQRVDSVQLFQSPPAGGTGYRVLASLPLAETSASVETDQSPKPLSPDTG